MDEPLSTNHNLRLIAMPHILSAEKGRIDVTRPAGGTVNDLMRSIGWPSDRLHARVFLDGEYVKDAVWESTVPSPGQSVVVRAVPMGGGGGGKDVGRLVAMIAVMSLAIAAPYISPFIVGAWAGTALTVGISIAGTLAISGLIPTPLPRRTLPQPLPAPRLQEAA